MTWTADHALGTTKGVADHTPLATANNTLSVVGVNPVPYVHRSHRLHNSVCLECGAYDRRLYDACQGRMAMD